MGVETTNFSICQLNELTKVRTLPLPAEWQLVKIEEIAKVYDGTHQTPHYTSSGVPFYSVEHVTSGDFANTKFISEDEFSRLSRSSVIQRGDVLMTRIGSIGDCKLVDWDVRAGYYVSLALLKFSERSLAAFFVQYSKSAAFKRELEKRSLAQAIPKKINLGPISKIVVPMPSQQEREKISGVLEDADYLIHSLSRLVVKKRQLKRGVMQKLLTGERRLPGFAGEWIDCLFGNIAMLRRERISPHAMASAPLCIELEHIESGTGRLVNQGFESVQVATKTVFSAGDVLFGKLRAYLRKYWLASFDGVCSTEIWALRPIGILQSKGYLLYAVQQDDFIEAASSAYGTHMPRSDWTLVSAVPLKIPADPKEQNAIAACLFEIDEEIAALEGRIAKAMLLKEGMTHVLLTGRIRIAEQGASAPHLVSS
jgi:type I restriction enzyme S subunit